MATKRFKLAGKWSSDFGVGLSALHVYNAPARDMDTVHIPGLNGDYLRDNKAFLNRRVVYSCWIAGDFAKKFDDFRDFLMAHADQYYYLEDDYHPDHVYEARVVGPIEPTTSVMLRVGEFDVTLDARPQRYRKAGMQWQPAGTYQVDTRHPYTPMLEITGTGTVTIQGHALKILPGAPSTFFFDCATMDAWAYGDDTHTTYINANQYVEAPYDGIRIQPGAVTVSAQGCTVRVKLRYFDI